MRALAPAEKTLGLLSGLRWPSALGHQM